MFRAILILSLGLSAAPAFAEDWGRIIGTIGTIIGGGRPQPMHPGDGGLRCSASDQGFEEHFGGHRDCRSCLSRHSRCVEECSFTEFACVARGYKWGRAFEVEEYGYNERDTEDRALWSCERRGGRDCRLVGRCQRQERSERRDCAQDGDWGVGDHGGPGGCWPGDGHGPGHGGGHGGDHGGDHGGGHGGDHGGGGWPGHGGHGPHRP